MRQYNKYIAFSLASLVGLIVPISTIHELGHVAVCVAYGNTFALHLSVLSSSLTHCDGFPDNLMLYWAAGGLAGLTATWLPGYLMYRNKVWPWLFVSLFSIGWSQAGTMVMETLLHDWYIFNGYTVSQITLIGTLVIYGLMFMKYMMPELKKYAPVKVTK